jgi:hypothetical protein
MWSAIPESIAGAAQRRVNAAKAVESHSSHDGRAVVLELLAERIRQAGKGAKAHSDAEILALDMRRADALRVGSPDAWDYFRRNHVSGRVAARSAEAAT